MFCGLFCSAHDEAVKESLFFADSQDSECHHHEESLSLASTSSLSSTTTTTTVIVPATRSLPDPAVVPTIQPLSSDSSLCSRPPATPQHEPIRSDATDALIQQLAPLSAPLAMPPATPLLVAGLTRRLSPRLRKQFASFGGFQGFSLMSLANAWKDPAAACWKMMMPLEFSSGVLRAQQHHQPGAVVPVRSRTLALPPLGSLWSGLVARIARTTTMPSRRTNAAFSRAAWFSGATLSSKRILMPTAIMVGLAGQGMSLALGNNVFVGIRMTR